MALALTVWRSQEALVLIDLAAPRCTWLVPGWVTVHDFESCLHHLGV